ncbi:flavoprotein [Pyronema omphalodes]|nr:flavoprotein [Pyronema omphalodes]
MEEPRKPENPNFTNLLIFATGSVATIKLPLLVQSLSELNVNIRVIVSPSATRFLFAEDIQSIERIAPIYRNEDEWAQPWARGDPVLHIELRKWADIMLIAPLSANSLAAMAAGMCPGLGLSVVRAWDTTMQKKILVAPAMNTQMWLHPLTAQQLDILRSWGWVKILDPVAKLLACGDLGVGGMMEVTDIVAEVIKEVKLIKMNGI